MALKENLKALRLKKGLSLQDVADKVGASKAHIWDLEQGRAKNPTIELLTELSRCFDVGIATLVGEDPAEAGKDEFVAMYRDLQVLSDEDRETIKLMIDRLRKRG